jgi:hypothetical protein
VNKGGQLALEWFERAALTQAVLNAVLKSAQDGATQQGVILNKDMFKNPYS